MTPGLELIEIVPVGVFAMVIYCAYRLGKMESKIDRIESWLKRRCDVGPAEKSG